jgi:methylmalonyl-CoA mutase N-terminal domain/subunit
MIHESAWKEIKDIEENKLLVVGVNCNIEEDEALNLGMKIDSGNEKRQISKLEQFRQGRDKEIISESLGKLRDTCKGEENIMPPLIEALKLGATVGEVNGIMREEFGTWVSPSGV